jgi:hypothetical protein
MTTENSSTAIGRLAMIVMSVFIALIVVAIFNIDGRLTVIERKLNEVQAIRRIDAICSEVEAKNQRLKAKLDDLDQYLDNMESMPDGHSYMPDGDLY